jgi:hypothetical protein
MINDKAFGEQPRGKPQFLADVAAEAYEFIIVCD